MGQYKLGHFLGIKFSWLWVKTARMDETYVLEIPGEFCVLVKDFLFEWREVLGWI